MKPLECVWKAGTSGVIGWCLVCAIGFSQPSHALEIRVKEQSTVQGEMIHLRDIASFLPTDDPRAGNLGKVDVASSPAPGKDAFLSKRFLSYKLASLVSGMEDVSLRLPEMVSVKRSAQMVSSRQLEEFFREHVKSHAQWAPEKIIFEKITVPEPVALPEGKLRWEIHEKSGDQYIGNVLLSVNLWVDGRQVRSIPICGRVSVKQEVIKAGKRIVPGQIIATEDLVLVDEGSERPNREALIDMNQVVGKKALRNIQPGQVITAQMFEDPPVVKKGSRVVLQGRNELIQVSALGTAREDGRAGAQVKVMNLGSGKEVFGTVKGPGLVEVSF